MFKNLLPNLLFGPGSSMSKSLRVDFYLTGGQVVTATDVKSVTTTQTAEGGFASYKIMWQEGRTPQFFSLSLAHISAIVAHEV